MATKTRIKKLVMEIGIPSEKDFESINQKAKNLANTVFLDLIEIAVNELNPKNEYIIDLLEIDLGVIDFDNPQSMIQKFLQILRSKLSLKKTSTKVSKSFKLENSILQFIEYGTIPWWLDPSEVDKMSLTDEKFSLGFLEKVRLLLLESKTNFFRFKNFLGIVGFDRFIKRILKNNYSFYINTLQFLEVLTKKTEHKRISANFDKEELKYLLFKGFLVTNPDKKEILLNVLKQFSEQTKQSIDEIIDISKAQNKNKSSDLSNVLNTIIEEHQRIQNYQNLSPSDASLILISYLDSGFEELPSGYAQNLVLDKLFKVVLNKYKLEFLKKLKANDIEFSPIKFQRLLSLFLRANVSATEVFLSEEDFSFFSKTISMIKSSQIMNLLERQKISSNNRNIDISVLKFIILHDFTKQSDKYYLEDFLKRLSKDFDIEYIDLIQEIYFSYKLGEHDKNITNLFEKLYNNQITTKYSYNPFAVLLDKKNRLENILEMNYFQRDSLNYFAVLLSNPPISDLSNRFFNTRTDLILFIADEIQKIKEENFGDLAVSIFFKMAQKFNLNYNEWFEILTRFINLKTQKNSFDHQILAKLIRRQPLLSSESKIKETIKQTTIFRFTHQKQLTPIQEESTILFMSLYTELIKNQSFKSKFSSPKDFEKFLTINLSPLSQSDIGNLTEKIISRITLRTQISYLSIVRIIVDAIRDKKDRNFFDLSVIRKYENSASKTFTETEKGVEKDQLYLKKKGFSFSERKIILFAISHLESLSAKSSFKSVFPNRKKLLDFLSQAYKSFPSNYEVHAELLDSLSSKIKVSYNELVEEIIMSIESKTSKTSIDYEFIGFFDSKDKKQTLDPERQRLIYSVLKENKVAVDYFKRKSFQLFFRFFINFKNKKNFNKIFKSESDLALFLYDKLNLIENKSFEQQIPLLYDSFGKITDINQSDMLLVSIEKLTGSKENDELSNRLLSVLIMQLLQLNPPGKSFAVSLSTIKNIDDLTQRMTRLSKTYQTQFLRLIFYPKVVRVLKFETFRQLIQKLSEETTLQPTWIDKNLKEVLQNSKVEIRERIRYVLIKILLEPKSINTEKEFLITVEKYLLLHDPQIIAEGYINPELGDAKSKEDQTKPSTIQKIVDLLSDQKEQFISAKEESTFEMNQFEYLLQHKNDIMLTMDQDNSDLIQKELDNFESIVSSADSLLFFLKAYTQDLELLLAFTELGLANEYKKIVSRVINQLSKKFLILEKRLIGLQDRFRFSNLEKNTFKVLLRALIFKNIGRYKTVENFSIDDFTYGFFEHLSRERYLNIRAISEIPPSSKSDPISLEINRALSVFTERGTYFGISKKIRDEVYFKDLTLAVLRDGQLPDWSLSDTFSEKDALAFVISKIENQDFEFTTNFVNTIPLSNEFLKAIEEKPIQFYKLFFQQIQTSEMGYDLSLKFQDLFRYFNKYPWNTKDDVLKVLSQFFLKEKVWRSGSIIKLSQMLFDFLIDRVEGNSTLLKENISKALDIKSSLFSPKKEDLMGEFEIKEWLLFFIEFGKLPSEIKFKISTLKKQWAIYLKQNSIDVKKLLRSYLGRKDLSINFLKIISEKDLISTIKNIFFNETDELKNIGDTLFSPFLNNVNIVKYFPGFLILIHQFFIQKAYTKVTLVSFLKRLAKQYKSIFSILSVDILELSKSHLQVDSYQLSQFLSEVKSLKELSASPDLDYSDLEITEYYVEFGSTKFDEVLLSKNDLFSLFQKLSKKDELLIKKRLHQWGNSKNKIRRILKLYPNNKTRILLRFIHPDLDALLDPLDQILQKKYKTTLPEALSLENWEGVVIYSFGYWSSKNLILYTLKDLIQMFLAQIINQIGVYKEDFTFALKESKLKTSNLTKQSLIDWTSQLDASPIDNKRRDTKTKQVEGFEDSESILVQNSGLIILWPFLSRLFDKLNLLDKKNFIDTDAQQKAILLTEYLVTGKTEFQESFLLLNKIICGAEPDMFVDVNIPLEKFELELCESLLKSVIKNWEKIENSTPSTLRETFLMREGALRKLDSDFSLTVLKKPYDLLMDSLPWSIGMIQTSFMKNRILVDWK